MTVKTVFSNDISIYNDPCAAFERGKMSEINQFSSPNFPQKYLPNLDCVRVIQF